MGWKIYFWIYVIFLAVGLLGIISQISKLSLGDWISTVNNWALVFGLYVYTFNEKKYFNLKNIFLINLVLVVVLTIDYFLFSESLLGSILPALRSNLNLDRGSIIFATIVSLPVFYANFKLVTKK